MTIPCKEVAILGLRINSFFFREESPFKLRAFSKMWVPSGSRISYYSYLTPKILLMFLLQTDK